ncbi:hypothetical protein ATE47_06145 [Chryseobacterium sp. IHB B 17019]|nr:hypothetical protein ATE47_06145 [Chryseobacterium sp. IHB B 17019]
MVLLKLLNIYFNSAYERSFLPRNSSVKIKIDRPAPEQKQAFILSELLLNSMLCLMTSGKICLPNSKFVKKVFFHKQWSMF